MFSILGATDKGGLYQVSEQWKCRKSMDVDKAMSGRHKASVKCKERSSTDYRQAYVPTLFAVYDWGM